MAADNRKQRSKKPTHRLEDLDVREVSLVDRPANQQKFLVVKRDDQTGDLSIALTEAEEMAKRSAVAASEATPATVIEIEGIDKLDPLGILDVADDDQPEPDPVDDDDTGDEEEVDDAGDDEGDGESDDEGEVEAVTKAAALRVANESLTGLMAVVNAISKTEGGLSEEQATKLQDIAKALAPTAKAAEVGNLRGDLTGALSRLMSLVNVVKALDDNVKELPSAVSEGMNEVAATLKGAASPAEEQEQETDQGQGVAEQLVVYKSALPDGDLDLILKRGAKMKTARLSTLRRAVSMLSDLIKELEGGNDPSKTKTKKNDEGGQQQPTAESIAAQVTASVNASIAKVVKEVNGALETIKGEVAAINKRVDDVEGTVPDGNADDDGDQQLNEKGEPVQKKQPFWAGIV